MKLKITASEELLRAIDALPLGIERAEDGIPVRLEEGKFAFRREGEGYFLSEKRNRIFPLLRRLGSVRPPVFENLTYMLDCSRNAVPRVETVKELARMLAALGYDSLGLYMEDTFEVGEYPYFGYLRTPYTAEDIREIEAECDRFGIELVPYIQTLAHFNTLTRHYAMEGLFDTGDILEVGREETYRFLDALLSACSRMFRTRSINIGMDEAYMLGRGRYLDRNGYRPRFRIMSDHLKRVLELCQKYGLKPMMWSDMFFSQAMSAQYGQELGADILASVPKEVELIYWDYCSTDEEHYFELIEKHRAFPNRLGFAGAAWKWLGFTPDNRYSFACNGAAARACVRGGVGRFIVTGWGDNGAECSPFATLPALWHAASLQFGEERAENFAALTGMRLDDFLAVDLCNRVTEHDDVEEKNSANKYLLFNDVLLGTLDTTVPEGVGKLYGRHAKRLARAVRQAGRWAYLFETQYRLARTLELKADLGIRLRRAYREGAKEELAQIEREIGTLLGRIGALKRAFEVQWERENRANGFDVQDLRFGALKERLVHAREKLRRHLNDGTPIPELEEALLDHMGHGADFEIDPDQCEWRWRRMTSVNMNE